MGCFQERLLFVNLIYVIFFLPFTVYISPWLIRYSRFRSWRPLPCFLIVHECSLPSAVLRKRAYVSHVNSYGCNILLPIIICRHEPHKHKRGFKCNLNCCCICRALVIYNILMLTGPKENQRHCI